MKRFGVSLALAAMLCAGAMHAQATPAATKIEPSKSFDALFTTYEKQLIPLVEAMPEDKFDFAPSNSDFKTLKADYAGVRTFRQEVTHLAQSFYFIGSMVSGTPMPGVKAKAVADVTTKAELVAALKDAAAYVHTQIATLTVDNAFDHTGRDPVMTRASAAGYVTAHGFDHYGQLVEYLRMSGITPPASANSKPANPAKKD